LSDPNNSDSFGGAVAISGDTLVAGAVWRDTTTLEGVGAAYVFVRTGTAWTQQAELMAPDKVAYGLFGRSVAITGDTLVAGALSSSTVGAAYVFTRTANAWAEQAKLVASDAGDSLGIRVDISADTVVAGAENYTSVGGVYVFVRSGGAWSQQAKLDNPNPAGRGLFGAAVAIAGDTVVVGSPVEDNPGGTSAGAAFVFVRHGAAWSEQARLADPVPATEDYFGSSVDIVGNTAVVGAGSDDNTRGSAFVFVRNGVVWTRRAKLVADDAAGADNLGSSVAASADMVAASAYRDDTPRGVDTGSVYVFPFAETDGDGLLDSWETNGLDADGDGTIDVDLPAMGADP
jgi:hypothetical protein